MENVPRLMKFRSGSVFDSFVRDPPAGRLPRMVERGLLPGLWRTTATFPPGAPGIAPWTYRTGTAHPFPRPICHGTRCHRGSSPVGSRRCGCGRSHALHERFVGTQSAKDQAPRPDGTWRDWPEELVTECHRRETGRGYASVYGRMAWDRPSPTITTQFYGFGNGRFGHPEQDRAISLREGAILQSFPKDYVFIRPIDEIHFTRIGRLIGNAVPFALARAIARSIRAHLEKCYVE